MKLKKKNCEQLYDSVLKNFIIEIGKKSLQYIFMKKKVNIKILSFILKKKYYSNCNLNNYYWNDDSNVVLLSHNFV